MENISFFLSGEYFRGLPCIPFNIGFSEDYKVLFIATCGGVVFMVHLESAQFKKLPQKLGYRTCYPFTSFCTAGKYNAYSLGEK